MRVHRLGRLGGRLGCAVAAVRVHLDICFLLINAVLVCFECENETYDVQRGQDNGDHDAQWPGGAHVHVVVLHRGKVHEAFVAREGLYFCE